METKSSNQQKIFRQRCNFCGGDHWNDDCPDYATVEERKQILKRLGSCFVCLKRGHRAFECLNKKTCYFCKRENHHHRSLCYQNGNCITVDKTKITNIKTEEYNQILNEMQQTKLLLEESKKENTTLKERVVKLEVEQEFNQTSVSRFTEITQQLKREIVQVKEKLEHYEHKNNTLSVDSAGTTAIIAKGNTNQIKHDEKQRISESKIEDRNKNIKTQIINEKLQKSQMRLQHTDEQIEEYSFLESERAQRKGNTLLTNRQSADGGTGMDSMENAHSQMKILKSIFKGLVLQQDCKAASLDSFTNDEQIMYAWVKMLGLLTQSKLI